MVGKLDMQPTTPAWRYVLVLLQALIDDRLMLDPVPHEHAQEQGSLLVAYSSALNQVRMLLGRLIAVILNARTLLLLLHTNSLAAINRQATTVMCTAAAQLAELNSSVGCLENAECLLLKCM